MGMRRVILSVAWSGLLISCSATQAPPTVVPVPATTEAVVAELAARYQQTRNGGDILTWTTAERRVGFANIRDIYPTHRLPASATPYALPAAPIELDDVRYRVDDQPMTLSDFLDLPDSIGLIVVHDGKVLLEDYAEGHGPDTPWMSFSVTKSVTSMLIGAAIQDGYIGSVDDPVSRYLPQLSGTGYDRVSIADALQMASGIDWNEDYRDPESDVARAGGANGIELYRHLAGLPWSGAPGASFNYNTGETNLVGAVLRAAIGNNATSYLARKIWQPFGMGDDADWVVTPDTDAELGGCCLNATLRDYARIGLFAMHDGVLPDGTRVLPEGWMARSTSPSAGYDGYGYLWWLGPAGTYSARGIFGQVIFIDPANRLVIALHGNADAASGSRYNDHVKGLLGALRERLAGER